MTYCPLCNSAIAFDRRVNGEVLDFGTTGLLRKSDLVMWDRQTESWWQQITGEAIVGELTGTKLDFIPIQLISWLDFKQTFPDGRYLTRETGFDMEYNLSPYASYDISAESRPYAFYDRIDNRLEPLERIIGVSLYGESVAYPLSLLQDNPVIHDRIQGDEFVILFSPGTQSIFREQRTSFDPDVGAAAVYEPELNGRKLNFASSNGNIVDSETGSQWNVLGRATSGELKGQRLKPVMHTNHFWFAWQTFNPETAVRTDEDVAE